MDGTLLDLRFDNWFWQAARAGAYAARHGLTALAAGSSCSPASRRAAARSTGTASITGAANSVSTSARSSTTCATRSDWLPGAARVPRGSGALGKRRILVTNAHPETLAIKDARVVARRAGSTSCIRRTASGCRRRPGILAAPRRARAVRSAAHAVRRRQPGGAGAARDFGIRWLRAIRRPDLGRPARDTGDFAGVDSVAELDRRAHHAG